MSKWWYHRTVTALAPLVGAGFLLNARGRVRLAERFGHWKITKELNHQEVIWFHAASVGEVGGLEPLVRALGDNCPQYSLLLTSTSATGLHRGASIFTKRALLPFDADTFYRTALGTSNVRALVLSETELWPGLIDYLSERQVPILLINASITPRSFERYRRFPKFWREIVSKFSYIGTTSALDAERFVQLGAASTLVHTIGNTKYDRQPSLGSTREIAEFRASILGAWQGPVLVLGSLRPGEDEPWFSAIRRLGEDLNRLRIIIAPRHPEKFDYFSARLNEMMIPHSRLSSHDPASCLAPVILADTLGILERLYSLATVAFVGGSLVPIGGHNPLEAANYGVAVAMGPHVDGIADIAEELRAAGALIPLNDNVGIEDLLARVVKGEQFQTQGKNARAVAQRNYGASARYLQILKGVLAA